LLYPRPTAKQVFTIASTIDIYAEAVRTFKDKKIALKNNCHLLINKKGVA
jgi:hypothetical protein